MTSLDIVVLTDRRWINTKNKDAYTLNVLHEDELMVNALRKAGLNTDRKAWDDGDFNWASTKSVLFRTTWDYFERYPEFSAWLNKTSTQTRLFNSEKLIRWNVDKHYLNDLKQKGIRIPPTLFIEKLSGVSLGELLENTGWNDAVLKPCISGAARHTYRINPSNFDKYEAVFKQLLKQEAMMLQPFQHNIVAKGEVSAMVIDGSFTHAILKKAKPGDFRVQDDFGGSVHEFNPDKEAVLFAENAVEQCIEKPIYARVDMFLDNEQKWALSEMELIEPELWFRHNPEAATKLAVAIANLF